MPTQHVDDVIDDINKKLDDVLFLTFSEVKALGVFGSSRAIRSAIRDGRITSVRVSPRRCVIPKSSIVSYIKLNISTSTHQ